MDEGERIIRVFELLAYLASSARGLLEEPREYGPLRCLDAMRRLISFVLEERLVEDDEVVRYLEELRGKLSRGMSLLRYSAEEFRKFVADLNVDLVERVLWVLEKYHKG